MFTNKFEIVVSHHDHAMYDMDIHKSTNASNAVQNPPKISI